MSTTTAGPLLLPPNRRPSRGGWVGAPASSSWCCPTLLMVAVVLSVFKPWGKLRKKT